MGDYMTTKNPYKIESPALISFSGGRTSGYMMYHILDAFDGKLPEGVYVTFANTGKERTETLDFVNDCSGHWGVPIHWLEFRDSQEKAKFDRYIEVDYESASRDGTPFDALINRKGYLPNPMTRFCTVELKIRVMRDFAKSTLGWKKWTNVIGLRADEANRVTNMHKRNMDKQPWTAIAPMHDAGVSEDHVMEFWSNQPFDLKIQSHEGNCDLCFLKATAKINRILRTNPELGAWWIGKEKDYGQPFRIDRPTYGAILEGVQMQSEFNFGIFDDLLTCDTNACTD